jgi:hypothetical protein
VKGVAASARDELGVQTKKPSSGRSESEAETKASRETAFELTCQFFICHLVHRLLAPVHFNRLLRLAADATKQRDSVRHAGSSSSQKIMCLDVTWASAATLLRFPPRLAS